MTPDITINVVEDTTNEVLVGMMTLLRGRKLKGRAGYNLTRLVQGNLRSLPPNRQGWPSQGFYEGAARGTSYEVTEEGAVVSVDNPDAPGAIKFAYNKGNAGMITITANGKLLTVPARAEFYGHSAREFTNLKFIPFKSGAKALVIGTGGTSRLNTRTGDTYANRKGIGAKSAMMVAYWLVDHVDQKARPHVLPTPEAMQANVKNTVAAEIAKLTAGEKPSNN